MEWEDSRTPLLQTSSSPSPSQPPRDEEIVPLLQPYGLEDDQAAAALGSQNQRLESLDVFRGLTIALMILVDDAGGAFPTLNHSPWFGVTVADFVMPFFLFIVGVSIGIAFKKVQSNSVAMKKIIFRVIKLFLIGLFLQGGYFHGRGDLTYGVDLEKIRLLGVLQRIAMAYLIASVSEIYLTNDGIVDSAMGFMRKYYIQWIAAVMLCAMYMSLLHGLYVPTWNFEIQSRNSTSISSATHTVQCGVRSNLEPPCNAVGFIDRLILGENHLYRRPVYQRTEECSVNSPDYGPMPPNAPNWCLAPFDPEGILSSLMAVVTCLVGLHWGHIIIHFKDHKQRAFLWCVSSVPLIIVGFVLQLLGIPLSKPLYTLSYMCITAGASGVAFTAVYYLVDVLMIRKPAILLKWMGMNALIIYALAACDIFVIILQGFYRGSPENNLVDGTQSFLQGMLHSEKWGTLAFVILQIVFWGLVAGYLHMKRIYVKL